MRRAQVIFQNFRAAVSDKPTPNSDEKSHHDQEQLIEDASLPYTSPPATAFSTNDDDAVVGSFIFPLRKLAVVNVVLLAICYCLLSNTCIVASRVNSDPEWKVITTWKILHLEDVRSRLDNNEMVVDHVDVGDVCEVYGNVDGVPNDENIRSEFGGSRLHMVSPVNGWLSTEYLDSFDDNNNRTVLGMKKMGVSERQIGGVCPLFGVGQTYEKEKRFNMAPLQLVVAQLLWNAVQVVHLLLLLCIVADMTTDMSGWSIRAVAVGFVTALSVAMLPLSVYFVSPGGIIYSVLVLLCSLFPMRKTSSSRSDELRIIVTDKKESVQHHHSRRRGSCRYLGKVELVAFLCNLGSSMYNYAWLRPSIWRNMFRGLDSIMDWPTQIDGVKLPYSLDCFIPELYTLGIPGVRVPLFIPRFRGSTTGHLMFLLWWSWLPLLYTIYFGLMYAMSHNTPGSKIQKGLCVWGILHFLFLTDAVDYSYGRGYKTFPFLAELCHWSERFVWRIAILLPVYQNVCSGKWKQGRFGIVVHYLLASWGVFFFVYQVIMNDVYKSAQFFEGTIDHGNQVMMFGVKYTWVLGYFGALVYMWLFYAAAVIGCLPARYVSIQKSINANTQTSSDSLEVSLIS